MVVYGGYDVDVWFKEEGATYGDVSNLIGDAYSYIGPVRSLSVGHKRERVDTTGCGSRTRRHGQQVKQDDTLSIEVPLQIHAGASNDNWDMVKEVVTFAANLLKQFSIVWKVSAAGQYFLADGVYLDDVEISTALNELIVAKITFSVRRIQGPDTIAGLSVNTVGTWETAYTDHLQIWNEGAVNLVGAGWTQAAGALDDVSAWSVSIKNNIEKIWGWTNIYPTGAFPKALEVSGSLTFFLEDYAQLTELTAETYEELHLDIDAAEGIEITNATFDSFDIDYSEVDLIEYTIPFVGNVPSFT